ncbi:hypothetical protein Rhe02_82270 [Rhizocola hellebori]|uniref:Right handed beta helix domain-containing protein n=1 Tax=Rhizocola hellebori TaxID=1392758 RepID=A0A8J3QI74_9ACTN|nr:hypothetical protein Rhe02_82270 [Rhizocola hellebori]
MPALIAGLLITLLAGAGVVWATNQSKDQDPTALPETSGSESQEFQPTGDAGSPLSATASPGSTPSPTPKKTTPTSQGPIYTSWPNASNTGVPAGKQLTAHAGDLIITKAGTVIDGLNVKGCISVRADNVTVKNTLVRAACAEGSIGPGYNTSPKNLLIQDVEIDGLGQTTTYSGVSGNNFTCRRCKIHGTGTGIRAGSNSVIEDSYLYGNKVGGESHNTAMSIHGGSNIVIRHNYLQCDGGYNCSSALSLYSRDGTINGVTVQENLFSGGGYCVYGGVFSDATANNVKFLNNGFLKNQWPKCGDLGPVAAWDREVPGNVWSGNYWYPDRANLVTP